MVEYLVALGQSPIEELLVEGSCVKEVSLSHTERIPERRLANISAESNGGTADSPKQNPKSLNDLLTDEPLSYGKAVPILADTLLSLDEIHTSNRQHVPLQPYAIQLTASGRVVITSQPADSAPATVVFGGAKYSAPEAFRENAGAVPHAASDSYVVAFIFYELLAGARVFGSEFSTVDQRSPAAWLNWHTNESKRARALAHLLPGFPSYLSDLLDEMLEKDPQRRQFNFRAIAEKLLNISEPTILVTKPFGPTPLPKQGNSKPGRARRIVAERLTRLRSKVGSQLSATVRAAESVRPLEFMRRAATFLDDWKVITAFAFPFVILLLSANVISSHYEKSDISTVKEKLIPPFIETDTGEMVLVYRRDAPSFYIDRTEVSNKDYRRFCESTGRTFQLILSGIRNTPLRRMRRSSIFPGLMHALSQTGVASGCLPFLNGKPPARRFHVRWFTRWPGLYPSRLKVSSGSTSTSGNLRRMLQVSV